MPAHPSETGVQYALRRASTFRDLVIDGQFDLAATTQTVDGLPEPLCVVTVTTPTMPGYVVTGIASTLPGAWADAATYIGVPSVEVDL